MFRKRRQPVEPETTFTLAADETRFVVMLNRDQESAIESVDLQLAEEAVIDTRLGEQVTMTFRVVEVTRAERLGQR